VLAIRKKKSGEGRKSHRGSNGKNLLLESHGKNWEISKKELWGGGAIGKKNPGRYVTGVTFNSRKT